MIEDPGVDQSAGFHIQDEDDETVVDDPYMTLAEAVRWAAWRGRPEPRYGLKRPGDGQWTSFGDLPKSEHSVYRQGADEVRRALASGQLDSWSQTGREEPRPISKAHWSRHFSGPAVSWAAFYYPYDLIIVERSRSVELWPANESQRQNASGRFSNDEIVTWINATSYGDVKKARDAFMREPRAHGLSATFETVWRELKQRGRGRPPKVER